MPVTEPATRPVQEPTVPERREPSRTEPERIEPKPKKDDNPFPTREPAVTPGPKS